MDESRVFVTLAVVVLRIIGAIVCSSKAKALNRNTFGWGFFGFAMPIIAMIWVHCMKPKMIWDNKNEL